jgi:hypothetical protein
MGANTEKCGENMTAARRKARTKARWDSGAQMDKWRLEREAGPYGVGYPRG